MLIILLYFLCISSYSFSFFFQAEDGIRDGHVTGVQTCALPIFQAQDNMQRARLAPGNIRFENQSAQSLLPPAAVGSIVTNPPYGERLSGAESEFWYQWSTHLKTHYDGLSVNIISSDLELPQHLQLRPDRRFAVYNGALDCGLVQFEIHGLKT